MPGPIDLHTHTSASDGTSTPEQLVREALEAGLSAVAVTDHDTVSGLDEAFRAGEALGVEVIRGCELAVSSPYGEVHLVGLWLPQHPARLAAALEHIRKGRDARNREMTARFREAGHDISYEELVSLARGEAVGRPHMARLLVNKGICASVREAFTVYLGDGKPMYVPRALPTPEEGLGLLKGEGATVAFAHPMLLKAPPEKLERLVGELATLGLDAIEAYHSEHDAKATRRAVALAKRHKLALSGGSDYHGGARPDVSLGTGRGNLHIPYAVLENLRATRREQGLSA